MMMGSALHHDDTTTAVYYWYTRTDVPDALCTSYQLQGSYSFAASSDSLPPRRSQPAAPAVTDSVQAPEVQQPEARPPRCSSRPPLSIQPKGRKGLREDTSGAD